MQHAVEQKSNCQWFETSWLKRHSGLSKHTHLSLVWFAAHTSGLVDNQSGSLWVLTMSRMSITTRPDAHNHETGRMSMMTSSIGNIFRVTGHLCGEVTGEFPSQRPVTLSVDVFFDLRLNKRLSKQLWGWRFETPSRSLWCHCNECGRSIKTLCSSRVRFRNGACRPAAIKVTKIANTPGSTSNGYRSDTFAPDRCLIDVDSKVFAI